MSRRLRPVVCCIVLTFILGVFAHSAAAEQWTRFRGPNGEGVSDATSIPSAPTEKDYNWKVELPGEGHSSPVLWGNKLFTMSSDPKTAERIVLCIDANTGKTLWDKHYDSSRYKQHKFNAFASSTPAVDDKHVYVSWTTPESFLLLALDHAGNEVWRHDLGAFKSQHGGGTSPIVYKDMVVIANDQDGESYLLALNRDTGKTAWKLDGRGGKMTAYSTPCVWNNGERDLLIFNSSKDGITAVDPRNGTKVWEAADVFNKRSCSSSVFASGVFMGSCGSGGGGNYVVAVKPPSPGNDTDKPTVAWKIDKSSQSPYVPTALSYKDRVYLVSDSGIASCVDPRDGRVIWTQRLGGDYFASPICINGVVYCVSRGGELVTFRAADTFELIGRHDLGEPSHATPAVGDGRLFIRTLTHLISIGGKGVG